MKLNGYVMLPRDISEDELWTGTPFDRTRAWLDMIILASFKERTIRIKNTDITIKPGELAYSTVSLATRWKRSRHFVINVLKEFAAKGKIEKRANSCTTIIRILDWERFQHALAKAGQLKPYETGQALEQVIQTVNSLENSPDSKNIETVNNASVPGGDSIRVQPVTENRVHKQECINTMKKYAGADASALADFLLSEIRKNNPYIKPPDLPKWNFQIGRMIEEEQIPPGELRRMIAFSQRNTSWRRLVVSPSKLKVHFHPIFLDMKLEETNSNKLIQSSWRPLI